MAEILSRPWRLLRRVPVEHRFLGLDRRTFPFALVALAVWALWTVVVPWVDRQVSWDDPIRAGDVLRVTDNVTMTPIAGWGLESGLRTTDRTSSGATASGNVAADQRRRAVRDHERAVEGLARRAPAADHEGHHDHVGRREPALHGGDAVDPDRGRRRRA